MVNKYSQRAWNTISASALAIAALTAASLGVAVATSAGAIAQESAYEQVAAPSLEPGDPLPAPNDPVILTVSGIDDGQFSGEAVEFDLPTLTQLGTVRFTTETNWTDDAVTFEGVLMSNLFDYLGVEDEDAVLTLSAMDDYSAEMPASDVWEMPVILAFSENGQQMSVRERGPLWVVYPQHAYPEAGQREYLSRWVWQLRGIEVN